MFGGRGLFGGPRRGSVAHFQDLVVQELFPASRQVWEFNLCHTPSTVITLREAPLKVVSELEVTELALAVAMVSDCLRPVQVSSTVGATGEWGPRWPDQGVGCLESPQDRMGPAGRLG